MRFILISAVILLLAAGCSPYFQDEDYADSYAQKHKQDIRAEMEGGTVTSAIGGAAPPIPPIHPPLAVPPAYFLAEERISISVTDDVPLKDVLFELARKVEINIELDAGIEGGINFTAYDVPFTEAIDRISSAAGLRYTRSDSYLRIEIDEPYFMNYPVDFLNVTREGRNQIAISTDVFSNNIGNGSTGGSGAGENGSSSILNSTTVNDFWLILRENLQTLLNGNSNQVVQEFIGQQDAMLPRRGIGTERRRGVPSRFTVNQQAGIVSVFASKMEHERVEDYLEKLRSRISSQVLIEAKVVEVTLEEGYSSGINWQTLFNSNPNLGTVAKFDDNVSTSSLANVSFDTLPQDEVQLSVQTGDFTGLLSLVEKFGHTRTLSSPRMTVLNNQSAIMKVAENQVFFRLDFERSEASEFTQERVNISSDVLTVPVGLVMMVQPSVNPDDQKITLTLRPTISRIRDFVNDPAVSILSEGTVTSPIPVVEVREIDSVLRMDSGQIVVMGGLMQERVSNDEAGLPGISNIPFVGRLAKRKQETKELVELVILLKASVLGKDGGVAEQDKQLYAKFISDPRPFIF